MKDKKFRHMTLATFEVHGWSGWWVRLLDHRNKKEKEILSMTFNVNAFGGDLDRAERAARRWRNKTMRECGYPASGTLIGQGPSILASKARKEKFGKDTDLPIGVRRADKVLADGSISYGFAAAIAPAPMETKTMSMRYNPNIPGDKEKVLKKITGIRKKWEKKYYK